MYPLMFLMIGACGIGGGVYWFFEGFRELKSSRTIQNIPMSQIMTGAVRTNVEIKGQIFSPEDKLLRAPISGKICAFYSVEIQKLVQSKDHSYWKKIDQFYSSEKFSTEDGTSAIAEVYVEGAQIQRRGRVEEFQIWSNEISSMPERLYSALQQNQEKLRVFKLKFSNFLQAKKKIENDPQLQIRFDRNQDGFLDAGELERGAQIVGVGLQTEPVQIKEKEHAHPVKMIFKKRKGFTFLISNIKENDLVKKLSMKAAVKVFGGPVLAIGCAAYLLIFVLYIGI